MIKAVLLKQNGNIDDIKLKITKKDRKQDIKTYHNKFKKYINNKNKAKIELIDVWEISECNLLGYGISEGGIKTLNKHELLTTNNNNKYYGDILLVKTNKKNIIDNLTSKEYETIYNKFYGYYESDEENSEYSENSFMEDLETSVSDSDNTSYDEMYDSEEVIISDYESDDNNFENIKVIKKNIAPSKLKISYTKELEYESYSSESD